MMKGLNCAFFVLLAIILTVASAAPKPAIVAGKDVWTVDVAFEHPQQILLETGRNSQPMRFWYTIITLTNKTGMDADFYPLCELMTDTFQIIPAGQNTPLSVFELVKKRHQAGYPFLESIQKTSNKILQGNDHTKDIAIIWPDFDEKTKNLKLFIAGLSNETVVIDHPAKKDQSGDPVKVYLRKTLELSYALGGDPVFRSDARLAFKGKRWVMR